MSSLREITENRILALIVKSDEFYRRINSSEIFTGISETLQEVPFPRKEFSFEWEDQILSLEDAAATEAGSCQPQEEK